jgi:polysaccharide export outer membrane protein
MKLLRIFPFLIIPVFFVSCVTQHRVPHYIEKVKDTIGWEYKIPPLRIQKNDQLLIRVYSNSTQREISDIPYNQPVESNTAAQGASIGFLVDVNGNIEYPRIGVIHVEGMTKEELTDLIKEKFSKELTDPIVVIRFLNYKITVIGEVGSPSVINVPGEKITILEAVGMAGGITDYGIKERVRVLREVDGKRELGEIDLTSKSMFDSPYYNLAQNDIILVDPTKRKENLADQTLVIQRISFALSLITAAAFIYNIFK